VEVERARELLRRERERIERALAEQAGDDSELSNNDGSSMGHEPES